jgi:hypothetical protein
MACDHETLLGPDADARVSPAPVDEEAVEVARRVAEWEEVEEDKVRLRFISQAAIYLLIFCADSAETHQHVLFCPPRSHSWGARWCTTE